MLEGTVSIACCNDRSEKGQYTIPKTPPQATTTGVRPSVRKNVIMGSALGSDLAIAKSSCRSKDAETIDVVDPLEIF